MKAVVLALFFVCYVSAQLIADFDDPPFFPGSSDNEDQINFPQNAGGGVHLPPFYPDAIFFDDQPQRANLPAAGYTTSADDGLTGAYPGQLTNRGVDPVRGIVTGANLNGGSSSASVTGRSGRGAASGNGFGISETKWPDRTNIHTGEFIGV